MRSGRRKCRREGLERSHWFVSRLTQRGSPSHSLHKIYNNTKKQRRAYGANFSDAVEVTPSELRVFVPQYGATMGTYAQMIAYAYTTVVSQNFVRSSLQPQR